jgi:hypothetical protein
LSDVPRGSLRNDERIDARNNIMMASQQENDKKDAGVFAKSKCGEAIYVACATSSPIWGNSVRDPLI